MADEADPSRRAGSDQAVAAPAISLPTGGGAIRGIGETFRANPATGTGSLSVPIATSPGRAGFGPQLALSYDSGSGNGPFGFGWSLSLPSITRKTDKGLPRYADADESDVYLLSGAEELVPVLRPNGERWEDRTAAPGFLIHRYRPRIDTSFARIERWTELASGEIHWRSISRDNVTTLYGRHHDSRVFDPADPTPATPTRIFSWLICESYDDKGNAAVHEYAAEDDRGVETARPSERDRMATANRYPKRIRYGNRVSRLLQPDLTDAEWAFEVVFDYDEAHCEPADEPTLPAVPAVPAIPATDRLPRLLARDQPGVAWSVRPDPFSSHRAGFEVRTYRRCHRVLMFHHIADLPSGEPGYDGLVSATVLDYDDLAEENVSPADELAHPGSTRFGSFLRRATHTGAVLDTAAPPVDRHGVSYATYVTRSLPPLEFTYSPADLRPEVRELDADSLANLPIGVDGTQFRWVDLDGEGLPGILTEELGTWAYKPNLGGGTFGLRHAATRPPLTAGVGRPVQLLDLAGDGQLDAVHFSGPVPGFSERTGDGGWSPWRPFDQLPNIAWDDPNVRFVDLDGDGHADILVTEGDTLTWYPSRAEDGFGPARSIPIGLDDHDGPRLVFAGEQVGVYVADMDGDGLADLIRVRNGEVCYWPNQGHGRFGPQVVMDGAPSFAPVDQFDQRRIRLGDVDGSGTTDLFYLGDRGVDVFYNQSGNRITGPVLIAAPIPANDMTSVATADLLGTGTACLVWSSARPADAAAPLRYIDLMGGAKPHLLTTTVNNLGAETHVAYAPSTRCYLDDRRRGRPWLTRLPFPVQVVERITTEDRISGGRFVSRFAYHHGHYDGGEREFRGFGMVEQWDTEERGAEVATAINVDPHADAVPVHTKTWFHTGTYLGRRHVSNHFAGLADGDDDGEYFREPGANDDEAAALLLDDTVLPAGLTPAEERDACRALEGSILRHEVYADDGTERTALPYVVTEHSFTIQVVQRAGPTTRGIFFTHPRESLTHHYERSLVPVVGGEIVETDTAEADPSAVWALDPRVVHSVTLEVDEFGNVLRSADIAYGRRRPDSRLTSPEDRAAQHRLAVTYTANRVTVDHDTGNPAIDEADAYRTPLPCESRTFELTGLALPAGRSRFTPAEVEAAVAGAGELAYEEVADSAAGEQRRLIEHTRTYYRSDDLAGPLPLGRLQSLALPFERHALALTPGLVTHVFGSRVDDAMLAEGGYVPSEGDAQWWVPSGRTCFSPDPAHGPADELAHARQHFFLPVRYRNPFHTATASTESVVRYDHLDMLLEETVDACGNRTTAGERDVDPTQPLVRRAHDYRVLQPTLVMDPNRNRTAAAYDALGMVVGGAVMGAPEDAPARGDRLDDTFRPDLTAADHAQLLADPTGPAASVVLGNASTRFVYDVDAYRRAAGGLATGPATDLATVTAALAREAHVGETPAGGAPVRVTLTYSDGFGREIQRKLPAEPGPVPARDADGAIVVGPDGQPVLAPGDGLRRWIGSGWTVFDAKGRPVRQYEPFFSDTHRIDLDRRIGVSPRLLHDPLGRVVATLYPNHAWDKKVFGPWRQEAWDVNDTLAIADPSADPDVGSLLALLPPDEYQPTWHALRTDPAHAAMADARWPDPRARDAERRAAESAIRHATTPTVSHTDSLGRPCSTVVHNRFQSDGAAPGDPPVEELHRTHTALDIEGNQRAMVDAAGRTVARFDYDQLGGRLHGASMEGGERWMLNDVRGAPLYAWDQRGHRVRTAYDVLRRPTTTHLIANGGPELVVGLTVYGDDPAEPGGASANRRGRVVRLHDQSGVVTNEAFDFKGNVVRRSRRLAASYSTTLDWSAAVPLEPETYQAVTRYDALNRPIQVLPPHAASGGMAVTVLQPAYNEANLLERLDAWLDEGAEPTALLDPATATIHPIVGAAYDAKGQRTSLDRGVDDGTVLRTTYRYDPETLRLTDVHTRRPADPPAGVQSLHYTHDPAGNIVAVRDDAQQTVFFANAVVEPHAELTYDARYRLIEATGREHRAQVGGAPHSYDDAPRVGLVHPSDGQAMGRYRERYTYDALDNLLSIHHAGANATQTWTRTFAYDEPSALEPGATSNRLTSTAAGMGAELFSTAGDGYDAHGNMLRMPHLQVMQWDFRDQLRLTRRQAVNADDADGQAHDGERTWYVYDASGERVRKVTELATGAVRDERLYLGGVELYRRHGVDPLERETLHMMNGAERVALVETRTAGTEAGEPPRRVRYQFGNHLGSASLELDGGAEALTYEEYSPYGSTTYQGVRGPALASKRYRYTGRERDSETGLGYHGARYYAPWLGRWTSADPIGLNGGPNLYCYCRGSPVNLSDPGGTDPPEKDPVRVTPLVTDVSLNGVSGDVQLHDPLSSDRSASGRFALSAGVRTSFGLDAFGLQTTGIASADVLGAVDTHVGRAGLRLSGGLVLGDLSGLHLTARADATVRVPVGDRLRLGDLPGSLISAVPQGEGDITAHGALAAGSFNLATFQARASLDGGRFEGRLDARSIGDVGRLRLDAAGSTSSTGQVTVDSARLNASVGVPGLSLQVQGRGTALPGGGLTLGGSGGLALSGSADLRLFGLPSLHAEGTGTATSSGVDFAGRFSGAGPLYTSYITGRFNLSTSSGISGSAGVFGLTYTPGLSLRDPSPPSPGLLAIGGAPRNPWTPSGLTLGASFFHYSKGGLSYVSGGLMPDLSSQLTSNLRLGVTAQVAF